MVVFRRYPANRLQAEKEARQPVVLVVDDEILVRSAVAEYLRISGYTVVEAANAVEAIAIFVSGEPIDVVFSDVRMPRPTDGLRLARWVYQHYAGIPVVLTSGNGNAAGAAEHAAQFFVSKPYRAAEVANRIHLLLEEVRHQGGSTEDGMSELEPL